MPLVHTGRSLRREVHQVPRALALRDVQWRQNRNPHDPRAQACCITCGCGFGAALARGHGLPAQMGGLLGCEPRTATTLPGSTVRPPVHEALKAPASLQLPRSAGQWVARWAEE